MPLPLAAVCGAALGFAGAQDCNKHETIDCDNDGTIQYTASGVVRSPLSPDSSDVNLNGSGYIASERRGQSVRFSEQKSSRLSERTVNSEGIRSMYSERLSTNMHRHMEVRLRSAGSAQSDDGSTMYDSLGGFVEGDFAAGKVKNIRLPGGCWVMSYSHRADLLAVGLKDRLDFLETRNYNTVWSLPRSDKVSAIQWCSGSALDQKTSIQDIDRVNTDQSHGELIAVAGLDGHCGVYHLDPSLLELKGAHTVYEFNVHCQVRCMAMKALGNGKIILAVGDKQGKITITTLILEEDEKVVGTYSAVIDLEKDPVLGLDIHVDKSILAASTRSGTVLVFQLQMKDYRLGTSYAVCGSTLWTNQRSGAVRDIVISRDGKQIVFGGYDKTLVLLDTKLYAVVRELELHGTINTIAMDPLARFLVVGCRDKSITFYDTTTFFPVKKFQTPGWVTSISWGVPGIWSDIVAVRSENTGISLLDLTPINMTDIALSSEEGLGTSLSWSPDGDFLARVVGDSIHVVDSRFAFCPSAKIRITGSNLRCLAFSPQFEGSDSEADEKVALIAAVGLDGNIHMLKFTAPDKLILVRSVFVEENLWVVSWSRDGNLVATGGKGKNLSVFTTEDLQLKHTASLDGRIWDIGFVRYASSNDTDDRLHEVCALAVASGDYKTIFFDQDSLQPTLQVIRPRTVRCLDYHPTRPLLAVGDGAAMVAIVDYRDEATITEIATGGRVNVLEFSPAGDYLLVGTDNCVFKLHETQTFKIVQEFERSSFALAASFSSTGKYLALGSSNEPYSIVRLGPLLGIDFVPLGSGTGKLPKWALHETIFRSGYGPSLVQRHMMKGTQDSLQWVAGTLKEHPDAIYTINRLRGEGCFDAALRLRRMKLLQLAVITIVDGSLENHDAKRSILTTDLPEIGKTTIGTMLSKFPAELIVHILEQMTFVKVPFTGPHVLSRDDKMTCGSPEYLDPWKRHRLMDTSEEDQGKLSKTPAVLPIPGLGTMAFLSALVSKAPAEAFDNEGMALVLRVMWQNHIRKYFIVDTVIFVLYFVLWILLIDSTASSTVDSMDVNNSDRVIAIAVLILNALFATKEIVQSDIGRRPGYFLSIWNQVDVASILLVFGYTISTAVRGGKGEGLVPLAVVTTLLLTMKLISYLRAFHETGWLVTVLSRNFQDVRGFMLVLFSILLGFSVSFRLLFANNDPSCNIEIDPDTEAITESCDGNPFGSLRKSILSTFELTILGQYESSLLYESSNSTLSILTFVLAVTCVLVVALNALISLLADSYARVQENAIANRRKEKAELIVEYMSLLPPWRRRQIERDTTYFHALLEADSDGDLVLEDDDWHGGMNALREDIEENSKAQIEAQQKGLENLKFEFDRDLLAFRHEVLSILQDLSEAVKKIQGNQGGGVTFSGKRVAGAVKAVSDLRRKGKELLKPQDKPSNA